MFCVIGFKWNLSTTEEKKIKMADRQTWSAAQWNWSDFVSMFSTTLLSSYQLVFSRNWRSLWQTNRAKLFLIVFFFNRFQSKLSLLVAWSTHCCLFWWKVSSSIGMHFVRNEHTSAIYELKKTERASKLISSKALSVASCHCHSQIAKQAWHLNRKLQFIAFYSEFVVIILSRIWTSNSSSSWTLEGYGTYMKFGYVTSIARAHFDPNFYWKIRKKIWIFECKLIISL